MFKAFLKIIPQLESSALTGLENALNSRFARVAKRFAGGLKNAILGGGIAALGLSVIDKLINPLKAVNEHIDSIFQRAEDLTSQAQQFGTTTGALLRLQTIGKGSGVDAETLSGLLVKFQDALVQARANPGQPSAVANFAGEKDTADAFFKFLRGLQGTNELNRGLALQEVFGTRKELSISKFLTGNLDQKLAATSGINTGVATANIANATKVGDLNKQKQAAVDAVAFQKQSGQLNNDIALAREREAKRQADLESQQLAGYKAMQNTDEGVNKILDLMNKLLLVANNGLSKVVNLSEAVSKLSGSRFFRLIGKKLGIGD